MVNFGVWRKAWSLLDAGERYSARVTLAIVVVAAFFAAIMVGSVMPFLTVLADPSRIQSIPALAWAYTYFGFERDYSFLVALGMGSLAVIVVANMLQTARFYAVTHFSMMRMHAISHRLLSNYLLQPYEYFLHKHSGELGTQILSESQQVVEKFFQPAAEAIASFLTVIAIVILLWWVDPLVTSITFVLVGSLYGGAFLLIRERVLRLGQTRLDANQERYRVVNEALGGVKEIVLLGREEYYVRRFSSPSKLMADTLVLSGAIRQIPQYVMQVVAFGGIIVLVLALISPEDVQAGAALGEMLPVLGVFAFAGQRLVPELSKLYSSITQLQYGEAAVETVHRDLQPAANVKRVISHTPSAIGLRSELVLERIEYRYPEEAKPSLSGVSLVIKAGERVGIVGTTGSGKTTLADVILGLLKPKEGQLIVDNVVIDDTNLYAWQQTIGYVPQNIYLIDSSIAANIAFGVPHDSIDFSQVKRAARIAKIEEFIISEMPKGFETLVGERGMRLSGGQLQRIGIARALYHDPDLIIFDEATSALDNSTEKEVIAAIDGLSKKKTVIMIAHRLSTVKNCDKLVVLNRGKVDGCGSWQELLEKNSIFKKLIESSKSSD